MRRAKIVVLWSLGALLLTVAAAGVFLAAAGDDFYRWALRQAIAGSTDREVRVDGTFSFDLGRETALTVTDVWITNAPWADKEEMARAARVEVKIALGPLFSGVVLVRRLVVEGLDLELETSAEGLNNWEDASPGDDDEAARPAEADDADPGGVTVPLLEVVLLKDIAVTYRDRQSGQDTEILLDFLDDRRLEGDAGHEIEGEGSFNRRPFQLTGSFGPIEAALAAEAPYPLALTLQASDLFADLTGTAENIGTGEGFDLSLVVRTASIQEVLRTFEINLPLVGLAEASARVRGDLASLAAEDIELEVIERSGQELRAEGRLDNLMSGEGLDLRVTGKLGPEAIRWAGDLPTGLGAVVEGIGRIDLIGQLRGDLGAPIVRDLHARLEHETGADLSLQGHAALEFAEEGTWLAGFEATTLLSLPDRTLLEQALETRLPDLGAVHATANISWAGDWITLHAAELEATALAQLQLNVEGRIGRLSGQDFGYEATPQLDLSAAINHSRPLVHLIEALAMDAEPAAEAAQPAPPAPEPAARPGGELVLLIQRELKSVGAYPGPRDGIMGPRTRAAIEDYQARHGLAVDGRATEALLRHLEGATGLAGGPAPPDPEAGPARVAEWAESLPELGPVKAAVRLSRPEGAFRFDNLALTLGTRGGHRAEVTGTLGALHPERDVVLEEIALAVTFAAPSSRPFAHLLPPELPEFTELRGQFSLQGTTAALSISDAGIAAKGPDGLIATSIGRGGEISLATGFEIKVLAHDLDARWPSTDGVLRFVDLDLPDLGPVWARATLQDRGETITLSDIDIKAGAPDQPAIRVTGEIGDLLEFERVKLDGEFNVPTTTLLELETVAPGAGLGKIHGRFDLSDADGSIGMEALSAEIEDTKLFTLSVKGLFDDIEQGDDLRMEAALTVPNVAQLGRELGFETEALGRLTFKGEISGNDENFRAEGKARLGETELTGKLSGNLTGERPVLNAKLNSPNFRFADLGLVPQADGPEPSSGHAPDDGTREPASELVFGETPIPFEALKQIDLDLDLLLKDVEGVRLDIEKVEGRADIVDGVLRIDPLTFTLVGGRVAMYLLADARGEPPELHLKLFADDVVLGDFLAQSEVEVPLAGDLDLAVDLKARGRSPRELAASLQGDFDLAVERGRVRTGLLSLATTNPVSWAFTRSAWKGYSEMNCLILRFDLEDGVAESQTLVLDTKRSLVVGQGQIDLRREFIDIEANPRAKQKRLIAMSTPFSIRGPLANPSVQVSTTGTSVRTAGEVLLSPLNLLGSLLPSFGRRHKDKDSPCLALQEGLHRE